MGFLKQKDAIFSFNFEVLKNTNSFFFASQSPYIESNYILTHGCEAWELTLEVRRVLNGFNWRCLNRITRKQYRDTAKSPDFDLILAIYLELMSVDQLVRRTFIAYVSTPGGPSMVLSWKTIAPKRFNSWQITLRTDANRERWQII